MLSYKIKRSGNDRVIHIILEDNYFEPSPVPRPATEKEITEIVTRERRKKVDEIIKHYERRKCQKKTQD
jgi:hypothetical protein